MSSHHQVKSSCATLAVETMGDGDPVVFLHAAVTDRRMWRTEMKGIATNNRAIAYDRRGFGETVANQEDFSSVADLMAVLDAKSSGTPAILVGCSQGGRIVIDAALTHPERVRGLVLIAPNVTGELPPVLTPEIEGLLKAQKEADVAGEQERISKIKARLWLDGPLAQENRVSGPGRQLFHEMYAATFRTPPIGRDMDSEPNAHRLGEILVPTLIIWGDLDFPHIQARCRHLAAAIPNASAHEMTATAHLPSLDKPAEVAQQLVQFVSLLPGRARE